MNFSDRTDAGRRLAAALRRDDLAGAVVLGLPRGGVVVAAAVADALELALDVIVVRKLGVPRRPELAMGAIGEDDVTVIDEQQLRWVGVAREDLLTVQRREREELRRRLDRIRAVHEPVPIDGRTVIVVDDGVATGSTVRAACDVVRARGAERIVIAVPVGPPGTDTDFAACADDTACLWMPPDFRAIGQFYDDFTQVSDDEMLDLLRR